MFKLSASGREITLYEIEAGETCILYPSCILSGMKYPADATTLSWLKAQLVPAAVFAALIDEYPEIRNVIFTLLSRRLGAVSELLEDVVFGQLDRRLREEPNCILEFELGVSKDEQVAGIPSAEMIY